MKLVLRIVAFFAFLFLVSLTLKDSEKHDHSDYFSDAFATPQDVTKACIECHEEQAEDFMKTRHWKWEGDEFEVEGKGKMKLGKKNIINNFCIAVPSNEPRCTSCHPGYGWKDNSFDFNNKENVDCLVCHDQTGTYTKTPTAAGMPDPKVDLLAVAKSVGKSTTQNCGKCHFNGGGGEAVKHGDLDPSLLKRDKNVDVHMGGLGFQCTDCHKTEHHKITGASHGSMAQNTNHISCEDCHSTAKLHKNSVLNKHTESIACETCHVPLIGRNMSTKTYWDWSTAGQKEDEKDANGTYTYSKMKGDFKWETNVVPEYRWYNGSAQYYNIGDKVDTSKVVELNKINGSISDRHSKITPFKKMMGKQPYDSKNNYLIVPKLFGENGYWKIYDWKKASEIGMQTVGLDFSGEVGFIETSMLWTQNHAVAPKNLSLKCNDCHTKGTRLNWEALGYQGDPMKKGGRAKNKLITN